MFSFSLRRPVKSRRRSDHSPFSSTYIPTSPETSRNATRRKRKRSSELESERVPLEEQSRDLDDGEEVEDDGNIDEEGEEDDDDDADLDEDEEDGPDDNTPLLPIFSAAHLDTIPVFALTHAIRILVTSRCDTVLTWEQLRSPQVSQFLLKPIEQDIRRNHLNAATHYALMANCLQYGKEAAVSSGSSGTNSTRAMVCELLAIKLLRDFSTRELIDALSYDFDPLQGQPDAFPLVNDVPRGAAGSKKPAHRPARISCLEIAIRAQSKRFLSHPVVVKQLEAIWAGSIVFHVAADNLHRQLPTSRPLRSYGTNEIYRSTKMGSIDSQVDEQYPRRAVTLYNPRDASLFKLSRLRVPRYRNIMSTISFAVLLSLFVAVLVQRSLEITPLEVVFWFWAAGFMLDEIVGFNEQGFSLYLASFWNVFDLGILLILFIHLALRIYGIVMPDVKKHMVANMAYDVLAADAILLFPRLFSVLDHYRYFSPLLIAFRYMAADLVAVSLLILISCSGFFVALTLSFGNEGIDTPSSVAYALLQMVMGFTPAAWDRWEGYNILGKTILTLFLFICHFLVVTILITVLTNSFMAIVRNANEEHQFLFAVNTISHVKSDALFSYVAPTNILQWLLVPLRYVVPFREYVKINRTIIKISHLPVLFTIFIYEKAILQSTVFDSIDLVELRGRPKRSANLPRTHRAPSIATFRQDRALEQVFKQPFDSTMRSAQQSRDRRKASNVVSNWMKEMGDDMASPPTEQDRHIVDRLEARVASTGHRVFRPYNRVRTATRQTLSIASDPEEFATNTDFVSPGETQLHIPTPYALEEPPQTTDAEGDDEMHSHEEDDGDVEDTTTFEPASLVGTSPGESRLLPVPARHEYFSNKDIPHRATAEAAAPPLYITRTRASKPNSGANTPLSLKHRPRQHSRNVSTATMIFKPMTGSSTDQSSMASETVAPPLKPHLSVPGSGARTPVSKPALSATGHRTPKRPTPGPSRMRPILPGKGDPSFRSTPNLASLVPMKPRPAQPRRKPSLEMDLVSDIGDNRAIGGGYVGALPSSFAALMAKGSGGSRQSKEQKEEQEMFAKIMMARMNSLEESFRDVIYEMREAMKQGEAQNDGRGRAGRTATKKEKARERQLDRPFHTDGSDKNADPQVGGSSHSAQGTARTEEAESQKHDSVGSPASL